MIFEDIESQATGGGETLTLLFDLPITPSAPRITFYNFFTIVKKNNKSKQIFKKYRLASTNCISKLKINIQMVLKLKPVVIFNHSLYLISLFN